ncbi:uncharacterized protein LOC117806328 [Xyrichtys novacula]|uniref:Uncharacterized protein LOC117806328 n=1 Tax=Xyrichtys novacula TaxID=13765 RepID=A0AAV1FI12_XYRNO|nr:uncharacterized protein LOC117806328 [Xyrichtys novacula]
MPNTTINTTESNTTITTAPNTTINTTEPNSTSTTTPNTTINTTEPNTTITTAPNTTINTTEPNSTSTTMPNTTINTTEPNSTSTTMPNTTFNTTQPNTTNTTQPLSTLHCCTEPDVLMLVCSVLVVVKMEISSIITTSVTDRLSSQTVNRRLKVHLLQASTILLLVFCGALEIPALVLTIVCDSSQATLIALVCVALSLTITEIVISSVPLGPSHDLCSRKNACDLTGQACSVVHEAFTLAYIYVCILEIVDLRINRRETWPLWVLIAYTAWIFLFIIWIIVFTYLRDAFLQRKIRESSTNAAQRGGKKKIRLLAAEVIVNVVSVIFILGTVAFAVAIIVGTLLYPEN